MHLLDSTKLYSLHSLIFPWNPLCFYLLLTQKTLKYINSRLHNSAFSNITFPAFQLLPRKDNNRLQKYAIHDVIPSLCLVLNFILLIVLHLENETLLRKKQSREKNVTRINCCERNLVTFATFSSQGNSFSYYLRHLIPMTCNFFLLFVLKRL